MDKKNEVSSEETVTTDSDSTTSNTGNSKGEEALSQYSNEQIEYARVWLQLGANQEIDELHVQRIRGGTPLNPDDDTSDIYPEHVIQLAGSRLVDGSVTYSTNEDGTINVYDVPLRWDGNYPTGEDFYEDIIDNTEHVVIDPGNDEEVIRLIKLLNVES